MTKRLNRSNLQISETLVNFIENEALPNTNVSAERFWNKLELITQDDFEGTDSVYKNFELVDYLETSEIKLKIVNFNFLKPTDYDEQSDF